MIVTFLNPDEPPLKIDFNNIPDLGDEITVDGKKAWVTAIGRNCVETYSDEIWHGQYTFDREKYFR